MYFALSLIVARALHTVLSVEQRRRDVKRLRRAYELLKPTPLEGDPVHAEEFLVVQHVRNRHPGI